MAVAAAGRRIDTPLKVHQFAGPSVGRCKMVRRAEICAPPPWATCGRTFGLVSPRRPPLPPDAPASARKRTMESISASASATDAHCRLLKYHYFANSKIARLLFRRRDARRTWPLPLQSASASQSSLRAKTNKRRRRACCESNFELAFDGSAFDDFSRRANSSGAPRAQVARPARKVAASAAAGNR